MAKGHENLKKPNNTRQPTPPLQGSVAALSVGKNGKHDEKNPHLLACVYAFSCILFLIKAMLAICWQRLVVPGVFYAILAIDNEKMITPLLRK